MIPHAIVEVESIFFLVHELTREHAENNDGLISDSDTSYNKLFLKTM
jgi:hypothetical protein